MRHAGEVRVGTIVLQTQPWSGMAEAFRTAEQIGYDVAYVADHLTHPSIAGRWLADGFTVLAAAATVTTRIDLGTLVASAVIRNPVTLARAAATVDDISGGRLVLGLGAGTAGDAVADRGSAPSTREMADRLSDVVGALEALWAGEPDFVGDHAAYGDVLTAPVAPGRGRPFTMIAAHGPRGLALAAAHGDGWSTYGGAASVPLAPDEFWALLATQSAELTRQCEERTSATRRPSDGPSSSATARCNRWPTSRRTSPRSSVPRPTASTRSSSTGRTASAGTGSGRTPTCTRRR